VAALLTALQLGRPGECYLFGARGAIPNLDLAGRICALLDERKPRTDGSPYADQITLVADRPGHDWRYAIDPSHAEQSLGWKAKEDLESGLRKTVEWYLSHPDYLIPVNELGRLGTRTADVAGAGL
jgi:dTDP-glucose 4,6-dehydratase